MASARKNFWALTGTLCLMSVGGALFCGYFLGHVLRILVSTILALPLGLFVSVVFSRRSVWADRLVALALIAFIVGFLGVMWIVAVYAT